MTHVETRVRDLHEYQSGHNKEMEVRSIGVMTKVKECKAGYSSLSQAVKKAQDTAEMY